MAVFQDLQLEKEQKEARVVELQAEIESLEMELVGLEAELDYLYSLLKEPWQVTCKKCSSILTITPPPEGAVVPQVVTPLYCPVCGAKIWEAPTEGYTVSISPAAEVPWYKKYAPHLALGGVATAGLVTYFSLRKRG